MPLKSTLQGTGRRQQMMHVAAEMFRTNGYRATTMRELASRMNIEAASLYNHISSKHDLLNEICFSVADEFIKNITEVEHTIEGAAKQAEQLIRFHLNMMLNRFDEVYVSNRDWKHLSPEHLTRFLQLRRNYENRFAAILKKGMEQNIFRQADTQVLVPAILSGIRSVEYWQRNKRGTSLQQLTEQVTQWLMHSLRP